MKLDYISIHFNTFMIPPRTKLESYNLFGSQAQLLQLFGAYGVGHFDHPTKRS